MQNGSLTVPARVALVTLAVAGAAVWWAPLSGQTSAPVAPMSLARAQAFIDAAAHGLDYLPGEVIVKFVSGTSVSGRLRALQAIRDRPAPDSLRWIDESTAVVADPGQSNARILAQELSSQPEVAYAEPNFLRHRLTVPNDPDYGTRQWNLQLINMPGAWDINPGGNPGITIAVVDYGITTLNGSMIFPTWNGSAIQNIGVPFATNPDLSSSRLISPFDFITTLGSMVLDTDGHGTHVSATAAEDTNNGFAEAGIAYRARIMPIKVCASYWDVQFSYSAAGEPGYVPIDVGGCPLSAIAQGMRYAADNGAKVINISLGGTDTSQTDLDAINYAVGKGVFVAMAAGNAKLGGNPAIYPAAYAPQIAGAMAVGAINRSGNRASYSSTGNYVEIAAPGGDDQDTDASGDGYIWQVTLSPSAYDPASIIFPVFDRYAEVAYEGTSMASPHVAGLAALLMAQGVTKPATVEALIKATAKLVGAPSSPGGSRNDDVGYGLIQPRAALFGFGVKR